MRTFGTVPRMYSSTRIQNWPASGWGLAMGAQSLPTCSSLQTNWQPKQPLQRATSMTNAFIVTCYLPRRPRR